MLAVYPSLPRLIAVIVTSPLPVFVSVNFCARFFTPPHALRPKSIALVGQPVTLLVLP
jgi:hypothetical protein